MELYMFLPTKECRECGQMKELTEFYPHPKMKDGHLNKCKWCVKTRVRKKRHETH